jgi:hypothetical protein
MLNIIRQGIPGKEQVAGLLLAASLMHGAPSHVQVRLETEEGPPRTFVPPRGTPVEVTLAQFDAAMARLVADLELPSPRRQRLALIACGQPGQEDEVTALTRDYHLWCERRGTPGDCLSLLDNALSLGAEARRTLALTISLVWSGGH